MMPHTQKKYHISKWSWTRSFSQHSLQMSKMKRQHETCTAWLCAAVGPPADVRVVTFQHRPLLRKGSLVLGVAHRLNSDLAGSRIARRHRISWCENRHCNFFFSVCTPETAVVGMGNGMLCLPSFTHKIKQIQMKRNVLSPSNPLSACSDWLNTN